MMDGTAVEGAGPVALRHLGPYSLGLTISEGASGRVRLAKHRLCSHTLAVKVLPKAELTEPGAAARVGREVVALRHLWHPHIIRLYDTFETSTDIYLVMEYVAGGDLFEYVTEHFPLGTGTARRLFQQIISAVEFAHHCNVVHRDLKPENVLLDKNLTVKLADFGVAQFTLQGEFLRTPCGTPCYAAPEVLAGQLYGGPEVDAWSCGVLLYVLLCGQLPFEEEHPPLLYRLMMSANYTLPEDLEDGCEAVLRGLLMPDPMQRMTIAQLRCTAFFQTNLPAYLARPPDHTQWAMRSKLDTSILVGLAEKLNLPYDAAVHLLLTGARTPLSSAYWLECHAKAVRHAAECTPAGPGEALVATIPDPALKPSPAMLAVLQLTRGPEADPTRAAKEYNAPWPRGADGVSRCSSTAAQWRLGLLVAGPAPRAMGEVYRALQALNGQWRTVAPFCLACRLPGDAGDSGVAHYAIVQLFRYGPGYLVDCTLGAPHLIPTLELIGRLYRILLDAQQPS